MSIFDPGSDAPITSNISLSKQAVQPAEPIEAIWAGNWLNRIYSWVGNANIAGFWFLDGVPIAMMEGPVESISQIHCIATNPTVPGCFNERSWSWQTLPVVAKLPAEGASVGIQKTINVDTTELSFGTHRLSARVFLINGPSATSNIFADGGACFPLQTASQGFPCPGIYGTTKGRSKEATPRCTATKIPAIHPDWTFYKSPIATWPCGSIGSWCCQNWTGRDSCYPSGGEMYVTCKESSGAYRVWSGWNPWASIVEKTFEETIATAKASAVEVAFVDFEVKPVSKTITVRATVLAGFPAPSLDIDIYANGLVKSKHWDTVAKGESVSESVEIEAGTYDVFAIAKLSNPFGSVEEESPHQRVIV